MNETTIALNVIHANVASENEFVYWVAATGENKRYTETVAEGFHWWIGGWVVVLG